MCKDRFLFFENYYSITEKLPDDLRLKFYDALMNYIFKGIEPEDVVVSALITAIKPSLDKEDGRKNNGGNHNPTGKNQFIKEREIERNQKYLEHLKSIPVNYGQCLDNVGQLGSIPLETRNKKQETGSIKEKQTKRKISFSDVLDWDSLFQYWEENKKGGMYKTHESRTRMLDKLKELTNNDFNLAKLSICHAIDNKYQGFCNGGELFYKPPKGGFKTAEQEQKERELIDKCWGDDDAEI